MIEGKGWECERSKITRLSDADVIVYHSFEEKRNNLFS